MLAQDLEMQPANMQACGMAAYQACKHAAWQHANMQTCGMLAQDLEMRRREEEQAELVRGSLAPVSFHFGYEDGTDLMKVHGPEWMAHYVRVHGS